MGRRASWPQLVGVPAGLGRSLECGRAADVRDRPGPAAGRARCRGGGDGGCLRRGRSVAARPARPTGRCRCGRIVARRGLPVLGQPRPAGGPGPTAVPRARRPGRGCRTLIPPGRASRDPGPRGLAGRGLVVPPSLSSSYPLSFFQWPGGGNGAWGPRARRAVLPSLTGPWTPGPVFSGPDGPGRAAVHPPVHGSRCCSSGGRRGRLRQQARPSGARRRDFAQTVLPPLGGLGPRGGKRRLVPAPPHIGHLGRAPVP